MESLARELEFVTRILPYGYSDGSGYGYGSGYSSINGDCDGYGDGSGYGFGDGDNSGYGFGNSKGSGYGFGNVYGNTSAIKTYNGFNVYSIDNVVTILTSIHGNVAKGFILNNDMILTPCYIVKTNKTFAHGKTLRQAQSSLQDKLFEDMPVDERIDLFCEKFKPNVKYPATDFFDWHNKLTGSCLLGRETFVKNKGVDMDGEFTVSDFISLCENDYGGEVIQRLKERMSVY